MLSKMSPGGPPHRFRADAQASYRCSACWKHSRKTARTFSPRDKSSFVVASPGAYVDIIWSFRQCRQLFLAGEGRVTSGRSAARADVGTESNPSKVTCAMQASDTWHPAMCVIAHTLTTRLTQATSEAILLAQGQPPTYNHVPLFCKILRSALLWPHDHPDRTGLTPLT